MSRNIRIAFVLTALIAAAGLYSISRAANDKPTESGSNPAAPAAADQSAVERALDKRMKLDFVEIPLKDVADHIAKSEGINVLLDSKALTDANITGDTPVTGRFVGIPLRQGLRLMLSNHEMNYLVLDDNVLLITSDAMVKEHVDVRVYDVHDLASRSRTFVKTGDDLEPLTNLIKSSLAPTSWAEVGGTGSIAVSQGALAVSQTQDVHDQIKWLLAALRNSRDQLQEASAVAIPIYGPVASPEEEKIRRLLETRRDLQFIEVPLKDVVDELLKSGIEVQLDLKSLTDANITADTPITFQAKQMRLRLGVKEMLRQHEMDFVVDREVVLITSDAKAKEMTTPVVYPVADLVANSDASAEQLEQAYYNLVATITSTVDPTSWTESGGNGSLVAMPSAKSLVCSQTEETHRRISELLANLRSARPASKAATGSQRSDGSERIAVVRLYYLAPEHADAANDYVEVIRNVMGPKNPTVGGDFVSKVPGAIVVRCLPATHTRIRELLEELPGQFHPPLTTTKGPSNGGLSSTGAAN